MNDSDLKYYIALTLIPGIGLLTSKKLIAYVGSVEGIFSESKKALQTIPKISKNLISLINDKTYIEKAENEIEFLNKYKIDAVRITDAEYPEKLKYCEDSPIILFKKGKCEINNRKIISIVGTRKATQYGKEQCKKLIEGLKPHNPIIVSGLALGIDKYAHQYALENNLDTIAFVGQALNRIYPAEHKSLALEIIKTGCIFTEFKSTDPLDKYNFVSRNRLIAGIADATVVVESGIKGGALITAEHANIYNRDVFAFPGKSTDTYSKGCNDLIKKNKAHLIESIEDLEYILNWDISDKKKNIQKVLFYTPTPEEEKIIDVLKNEKSLTIDLITHNTKLPMSKVSALLLNLEFAGMVKLLPGKVYEIC